MATKVIALDYPGRKLIIQAPEKSLPFWNFLLDEREFRKNEEPPVRFCTTYAHWTPEDIARAPETNLYNHCSSDWMGASWRTEIEPAIIAFIEKVRKEAN